MWAQVIILWWLREPGEPSPGRLGSCVSHRPRVARYAPVAPLGHEEQENGVQKSTLDLVEFPECAAPAEVVERFVLESTDGQIEHASVLCVLLRRFTVLADRLGSPCPRAPERGRPRSGLRTS
jgi:hypothetical protein